MKVKIAVISIFVIIAAYIGLTAWQMGIIYPATETPTMSNTVDGVTYRTAIMTVGYDKLIVDIQDIQRLANYNEKDEYLITDWQNKQYRVSADSVILCGDYFAD